MSNLKHTPGKWVQYFNLVTTEDGENVCLVNTGLKPQKEALANAALIAAAPEMLEALESAMYDIDRWNNSGVVHATPLVQMLQSVIKKAKGE